MTLNNSHWMEEVPGDGEIEGHNIDRLFDSTL